MPGFAGCVSICVTTAAIFDARRRTSTSGILGARHVEAHEFGRGFCFGTKRSWVRIPPPRPARGPNLGQFSQRLTVASDGTANGICKCAGTKRSRIGCDYGHTISVSSAGRRLTRQGPHPVGSATPRVVYWAVIELDVSVSMEPALV